LVRDLQIFVLSETVCWTRLEKLARDKQSSLFRKFINYRQNKFYNIGPWPQNHARSKHSSLFCRSVSDDEEKLYNIDVRPSAVDGVGKNSTKVFEKIPRFNIWKSLRKVADSNPANNLRQFQPQNSEMAIRVKDLLSQAAFSAFYHRDESLK
jgi:hypothetical protein